MSRSGKWGRAGPVRHLGVSAGWSQAGRQGLGLTVRDNLIGLSPSYPTDTGLVLLRAYLYSDYPPADTLTIYGSLNQSEEDKIDCTENVVEIEGDNHAQFGNYGPQKGDALAVISAEEQ